MVNISTEIFSWMVKFSTEEDFTASLDSLPYCGEDVFSCAHLEFPVFQFVPVASCPVTGKHAE